jgi:hypothetical protein
MRVFHFVTVDPTDFPHGRYRLAARFNGGTWALPSRFLVFDSDGPAWRQSVASKHPASGGCKPEWGVIAAVTLARLQFSATR